MQKTELVVFNKNHTHVLLGQFGFKIVRKKISETKSEDIVIDKNNTHVLCECCKKPLTPSKVGTIAKGSRLLFCDNPVCFATWVVKNKID